MKVAGVALEPGAETYGTSGIEKLWPEDELRKGADTLSGKPVLAGDDDFGARLDTTIGEVTDSWYDDGQGVMYEAEIEDEGTMLELDAGVVTIAPRLTHDEDKSYSDTDKYVPQDIQFESLFLCPRASSGVPGPGDWTVLTRKS